ncbi:MAG: hypothetical protein M3404_03195 [Actinomycetota bacterium]|nr:hypothetical protein [Actinomycetota bacterium]
MLSADNGWFLVVRDLSWPAEVICAQLASRLPHHSFELSCDGAYVTLIDRGLERTTVRSRLRRDTALYQAAPPPTGRWGRPATKGGRLPTPVELAKKLRPRDFEKVDFNCRGPGHRRHPRRRYGALRRALVDRGDLPRGEAVPGRPGPSVMEGEGARARRRLVAVALQRHLDVSHHHLRLGPHGTRRPSYPKKKATPSFLDVLPLRGSPCASSRIRHRCHPPDRTARRFIDGILDVLAKAA